MSYVVITVFVLNMVYTMTDDTVVTRSLLISLVRFYLIRFIS